jgi:hypothetical protein
MITTTNCQIVYYGTCNGATYTSYKEEETKLKGETTLVQGVIMMLKTPLHIGNHDEPDEHCAHIYPLALLQRIKC